MPNLRHGIKPYTQQSSKTVIFFLFASSIATELFDCMMVTVSVSKCCPNLNNGCRLYTQGRRNKKNLEELLIEDDQKLKSDCRGENICLS